MHWLFLKTVRPLWHVQNRVHVLMSYFYLLWRQIWHHFGTEKAQKTNMCVKSRSCTNKEIVRRLVQWPCLCTSFMKPLPRRTILAKRIGSWERWGPRYPSMLNVSLRRSSKFSAGRGALLFLSGHSLHPFAPLGTPALQRTDQWVRVHLYVSAIILCLLLLLCYLISMCFI